MSACESKRTLPILELLALASADCHEHDFRSKSRVHLSVCLRKWGELYKESTWSIYLMFLRGNYTNFLEQCE